MKAKQQPRLINAHAELRGLRAGEWIKEDNSLTEKANILLSELSSFFLARKKKAAGDLMGNEFAENMQKYVEIFPRMKLPSGKQARVHITNLETGFRWFFEKYSYSWEVILKATNNYVTEYEKRSYEHMRTSQYFIRKQMPDKTWTSDLADYCSIVDDAPDTSGNGDFEQKFT